jgi:uncharacterized protein DUF2380
MPRNERLSAFSLVVLGTLGIFAATSTAVATEEKPQKVAFVGFRIINDAMEPISDAENNRARLLDNILVDKLEQTGRFKFVPIPKAIAEQIDKGPFIGECNGCEIDYGRKLKADLIAWGTVQKVSNLILNLNVYMESVDSGKMTYIKSVDIRGNNDRSWTKGLEWMLRYYMPGQKKEKTR